MAAKTLTKAAGMPEPFFFSRLDSPTVSDAAATAVLCDALCPEELKMHQPSDLIEGHELKEKLGEGSFGVVWLTKGMVAVKIMKSAISSLELMACFEQEQATLAMMDHQNIVKVIQSGNLPDGRPFFVMELVSGLSLTEYCNAKSLALAERLHLFLSLCAGVQHAHERGVVHCDLKPANIIVTEINAKAVPKIIDFGISMASTTERQADSSPKTLPDRLVGTPNYMSPEQAWALPDIDARSDVYSLGALLYELVTGKLPLDLKAFQAAGKEEMRRVICEVEPPAPSTQGLLATPERAAKLDQILLRALAKDRASRYSSVTALASDIRSWLNDEPPAARTA